MKRWLLQLQNPNVLGWMNKKLWPGTWCGMIGSLGVSILNCTEVRPVLKSKRNVVILRDLPDGTTEDRVGFRRFSCGRSVGRCCFGGTGRDYATLVCWTLCRECGEYQARGLIPQRSTFETNSSNLPPSQKGKQESLPTPYFGEATAISGELKSNL